jgi:Fe2+ or Zn2+ uptake regulation protein
VPGCVVEEAAAQVQKSTGYQVSSHQVVFSGVCPTCRGPATAATR